QRARLFVISAALLDAQGFSHRDLDVVNVVAVPDRLEDAVAEAEGQNVLDRLLAEVMVNPVSLLFPEYFSDILIERAGRFVIAAERLFDDHAPPLPVLFAHQPG